MNMLRFVKISTAITLAAIALTGCTQPGERPTTRTDATNTAPAKPKITAQQLLGQDDAWVLENLGEPAFRRADRIASIWQYKNTACVLNLFLYADNEATPTPAHVLHFDARDLLGNNVEREPCLVALQD